MAPVLLRAPGALSFNHEDREGRTMNTKQGSTHTPL
jgi:hypothetical protein